MDTKRIDELRGIACLLVLAFHAVGSEILLKGTVLAYLEDSLHFIRMPIFIAITGLLYGLFRAKRPMTLHAWRKRVGRLIPPFVLLTVIVSGIDTINGLGFHPITALIFGAWHLWYILALAVILLLIVVIEKIARLTPQLLWTIAGVAALVAASGWLGTVHEFAIDRAITLLPFFLAGAAIGSTPDQEVPSMAMTLIYASGFVALILHQLSLHGSGETWRNGSIVATALGLAGFMLISSLCPSSRLLRAIGVHSLPIFLWHLPIYAIASGLVLHRFHVEPHLAVLIKIVLGARLAMLLADTTERKFPQLAIIVGARNARRRLGDDRREDEAAAGSAAPVRARLEGRAR